MITVMTVLHPRHPLLTNTKVVCCNTTASYNLPLLTYFQHPCHAFERAVRLKQHKFLQMLAIITLMSAPVGIALPYTDAATEFKHSNPLNP